MRSKGQAAMEFLMTYGWAILVVLVGIAALAYFGIFNTSNFLPEKCFLEPGISCEQHEVTKTTTEVYLKNGLTENIKLINITVKECELSNINRVMEIGARDNFKLTGCSNGEPGRRMIGMIVINYEDLKTSLNKTIYGDINAKIK